MGQKFEDFSDLRVKIFFISTVPGAMLPPRVEFFLLLFAFMATTSYQKNTFVLLASNHNSSSKYPQVQGLFYKFQVFLSTSRIPDEVLYEIYHKDYLHSNSSGKK